MIGNTINTNRPWRFRFSLKTAFVASLLTSICLGYVVSRQRWAATIETWDYAIRNTICENLARVPIGMSLIGLPALEVNAELQESQLAELRVAIGQERASVANRRPTSAWNSLVAVDATEDLKERTPIVVANRLLRHYEMGLAERGLIRIASEPGTCDPALSAPSSIWVSERADLHAVVVIDVRVDQRANRGDIRIRYLAPTGARS